ncbi:MAG: thermonuclease family protein [Halioglobus sp.]|nr:thermonuclease family protein [Halioglobus sp.]
MSTRSPASSRRLRQLRKVLVILALFSLLQYLTTGTVRWPVALYQKVTATLSDYATRPEAGWRRATQSLEEIGAAREGQSVTDFDLTGRVVRIADGDTVSILDHSNTQHKVRLYGIDTPERDQPYGSAAKRQLTQLIDEKPVGVVIVTTDSYGRVVGTLYQDGVNINVAMVASGYAWWYQHFAPHEHALREAEQSARQQGLGLWADPRPVAPWDWRRNKR